MNKYISISTQLGFLEGRDCIFLEEAHFNNVVNDFVLKGEVNQNLCTSKTNGLDVPFTLTFFGILTLKIIDLDSWNYTSKSCFDEVINSAWIQKLEGKEDESYHHYLFQTYDNVFEVVCLKYEFKTKK